MTNGRYEKDSFHEYDFSTYYPGRMVMAEISWQEIVIKLLDRADLTAKEQDYVQKNLETLIEHFSQNADDREFCDYLKSLRK
ncbi:MAG: hypothetical protein CMN77_18080 [Spirochaetaceae bacterium]|nr:hypothetical protein [Spirochaetaceae bacterium]|tara:strand:+ start:38972 stop:39217 length:246 start_codon:yes stop_codon:yes gene_type:complete